eukprot:scaffold61550_cov67-Phaeocystis_antarctica.AAC.4
MHVHVCAYMHMRMHTRMLRTPAPAHAHAHGRVQARLKMLRVNKKSTPVVDADGKFAGTLKYNAVVKAVKAGKAAQMVKAWMRREGVTVAADTPFDGVQPRLVLPCTHYVPTVYSLSTYYVYRPRAGHGERGRGAAARGLGRRHTAWPRDAHRRAEGAQALRERRGHGAEARPMRAAREVHEATRRTLGHEACKRSPVGSRRLQEACEGL